MKIKFGTDGWRAIIAKEYTVDNVARVAKATADWIKNSSDNHSVVIGHDCRFAGEMFAQAAARVLADNGVKVYIAKDFVSTPMVSLGCKHYKTFAGIVITASHNPPSYNGFKLKSHFGGPTVPADIAKVEALIPDEFKVPEASMEDFEKQGLIEYVDLETLYIDHCKNSFDLDAINNSNITLAYDAMWGAGKNVVKQLLPESKFLHVGDNPGFLGVAPEPIHRNLQKLSDLIAGDDGITAGLATDGDADRIGMYNDKGEFVDSHHLILLLIHYMVKYKKMTGKVIVAFSVTDKVKKLCEHYGLEYEVTKIGFKYICEKMVVEDALLGGEESGGIAIKGHIPERDGIWMGLTLLEFMAKSGKTIPELIEEVYEIVGPFAFNRNDMHITDELKHGTMQKCADDAFKTFGNYGVKKVETIDGYKFFFENDSWLMMRPSGTEPVLRVYAEAENYAEVDNILNAAKQVILN